MLSKYFSRILWSVALGSADTTHLDAQVSGVVEAAGVPLPGGTVVLWDARHELARVMTTDEGRFAFSAPLAAAASGLVVRAIGHEPRTMRVRTGDDGLRIALTPLTQSLPATIVSATRRQCPFQEDPAARALWSAIGKTYVTAPMSVGHLAVLSWRTGEVSGAEVGEIDEGRIGPGSAGMTGYGRQVQETRLRTSGYAARRPEPRTGTEVTEPAYLAWSYPELHRALLEHFVTPMFAERHVFRFAPINRGTTSTGTLPSRQLLFCPRDAKQPALEGTIDVASDDSSVARIRLLFVTPKPRKSAGGEVVLVPPSGSAAGADRAVRRLVPVRSVYWRRLAGARERYYQDEGIYRGWYWGHTDSIPGLSGP